jgi:hypothetical protein
MIPRLTSKVEHARLLALRDVLPDLDRNITRRNLGHANPHKRHQPDLGVIRLDEDDRARGDDAQVFLGIVLALARRSAVLLEILVQGLGVVRPRDDVRLFDRPGDGCVPPVVRERAQERLVHRPADKLLRPRILREHVDARVRLALDPELFAAVNIVRDFVDHGFARVGDDVVVLGRGDGADAVVESEETGELRGVSVGRAGG